MGDVQLNASPVPAGQKNVLERFLSLFSNVLPGEGVTCLLLAFDVFILLTSYYLLKTIRESLILSENGALIKSYSSAGQAALLLLLVPAYSYLGSKVNRLKLILVMTLFFASNLILFYFLGKQGMRVGIAFFLWVGVFNVFIVAQFWSFANDLYREEQGRRLFPIIGVGASLGAWIGAALAKEIFTKFDPYTIMLFAAAGIVASLPLTLLADRRQERVDEHSRTTAKQPLAPTDGFMLVFRQRYLLLIAVLTLLLNISNSNGEYLLGQLVSDHAKQAVQSGQAGGLSQKQLIGEIYGDLFTWVNGLGLFLQLFVVSRLFRYLGVRGTLFVLPCIALGSYSLIAVYPVLEFVRVGKILENSADYSIQSTTRQGLFLPTSREAKYKAKAAIDTFFVRIGDVLSAGVVYLGAVVAGLGVRQFAVVNLLVIAAWLGVAYAIFREHKKLTADEQARPQAAGRPIASTA